MAKENVTFGNDIFKILHYCKCISEINNSEVTITIEPVIDNTDDIPIAIWKIMSNYEPITKENILDKLVARGYGYQKIYYQFSKCLKLLWFNVYCDGYYTLKQEILKPITKEEYNKLYIEKVINRDYDICEKILIENMSMTDISKLHGISISQVSSILYTHFREVCTTYQVNTGINLDFELVYLKDFIKHKDFLISQLPLLKTNLLSRKWHCLHHKLKF